VRALRRIGELSRELEKAKPGTKKGGKRGGTFESPHGGLSKDDTLKAAGLTKQAAHRCEQLAAIPDAEFDALIGAKWAGKKCR
jgi:hypothetical protein